MTPHNKQGNEESEIMEKRSHSRHSCNEPTFFSTVDGLHEGVIKNRDKEGVKGIFIETSENLTVGDVVTVAISSPDEEEGKKLKGIIARKEPGGYAVQFTERLNV